MGVAKCVGAKVRECALPDCAERPPEVGVPQVVVPQRADQPYWAGRVAGMIGTDGAAVAATLLLDTISRERPPVPA
jgi:hypothetical protein